MSREDFTELDFSSVEPGDVGLDPSVSFRSSPSGNQYLSELLDDLNIEIGDRILDIGCGKGSAMKTMLEFPFSLVAGVELSATLAEIAVVNMTKLGSKRWTIHISDAQDFPGYSGFNYFYMYNPFPGQILDVVLTKIGLTLVPGKQVFLIYNNPTNHFTVLKHGWQKVKEYPDEWGNGIFLYKKVC